MERESVQRMLPQLKPNEPLGDYLMRLRLKAGFDTQEKAATYLGVSRTTVGRAEDRKQSKPEFGLVCSLIRAVFDRTAPAHTDDALVVRQTLIDQMNGLIMRFYKPYPPIHTWDQLETIIQDWERRRSANKPAPTRESHPHHQDVREPPHDTTYHDQAELAPLTATPPAALQTNQQRPWWSRRMVLWGSLGGILLGLLLGYGLRTLTSPILQLPPDEQISFLWDVNYPDDMVVAPGTTFDKSWRIYNGNAFPLIPTEYDLRGWMTNGNPLGSGGYALRKEIAPVSDDNVIIGPFTAPKTPGCYRTRFRFFSRLKQQSVGDSLWVQVVVPDPTRPLTEQDFVAFVNHAGINDGTAMPPNHTFTKGWMLHNCGETTWRGYTAVRMSGDFGPQEIPISATISPHQPLLLQVPMQAPAISGPHTAQYQLVTDRGEPFGDPFGISITVK
jgi:DNA-binding XRE family transcriptional regulator